MTKTKSRILTALALTTALTAPVLIAPMFTAPAAVAAAPTVSGVQDFSDLAAKVTPAVVNVAVTMKAGAGEDGDEREPDVERQAKAGRGDGVGKRLLHDDLNPVRGTAPSLLVARPRRNHEFGAANEGADHTLSHFREATKIVAFRALDGTPD